MCKAELLSDELGYWDKDISKQSVEGATWFLFPVCSKMWEEKDKLREELWNKGNRTWWKSQPPAPGKLLNYDMASQQYQESLLQCGCDVTIFAKTQKYQKHRVQ